MDGNLEIEKARLLSLAIDFGFDEEPAKKCLDRIIHLYGEDGKDFISVEYCGDDYLATLAEFMQDSEDWDDLQTMESEACGALSSMLEEEVLNDYVTENEDNLGSSFNVGEDSLELQNQGDFVSCDSSTDDGEDPDFDIASKPNAGSGSASFNLDRRKSSASTKSSDKYPSTSTGCKRGILQNSFSSVSNQRRVFPRIEDGTLGYEDLKALDDIELANIVIFGNRTFKPLQHQACKAFIEKRDCFILMPTGGGKSLCYQVISLISLFPFTHWVQ
ncbi:hypothetical protein GIB67_021864 [Kingdonia uniflora]|uniref:DEAD/DEAH-box helicase domain-containing protein n=1 Tax=Kingdonia uniflora TaxID=39325 RepID=A0A7J7NEY5_9MAGN|nr:hypothetical protein GIB67_021864 [Kingdonia uniflora]